MANLRLTPQQALDRALSAYQAGKFVEAEDLCRQIISAKPDFFDAVHLLAFIQAALGKHDLALASYESALALRPEDAQALKNRGVTLQALKRHDEALASYDRALLLRPDHVDSLYNRGVTLQELQRHDEALASYDRALALRPDYAEALNNRGVTLQALKRHDEALASYDRALALRPDYAEALNNRGNALHEVRRFDEAVASYERALAARPDYREALNNRGVTLHALRRHDEALASYDRALFLRPDDAQALNNRGAALHAQRRLHEALASYDRALLLRPGDAEALNNRAGTLYDLNRLDEALASYEGALRIQPDHAQAFAGAAACAIKLCDWDRRRRIAADLAAQVAGKTSILSPFVFLGYSSDLALQLQCARNYLANKIPLPPPPLWTGEAWRHDKLRIAYLSGDFRSHPLAHLTAGLFERHDRSRFDAIGVSFGPDDGSEIRQRLVAGFDEFHDARGKSDREIATLVYDLQVDIAVDLMGHSQDSRPGIFAYRPAPIQASYLGYPGAMAAPFIDYIIADKVVAPFEHQNFYTERIVHLPDCYWVTDRQLKIAERTLSRREVGLPEHGFVFCCFNSNWKIAPAMFDIWMRLLRQAEGSVLWLLRDNEGAERNLRQEAQLRGIDPSRLVFAGRLPIEEHLARQRLADLFLDTLPYNAHTTASDALWAGLPLITCQGEAFAGRVAASLLHAVGLPELIAGNFAEYEALALALARDPARLADIKARLARHRETYPLFDTARFARHLESAYMTMWQIWQRGEAPKSFCVEPTD